MEYQTYVRACRIAKMTPASEEDWLCGPVPVPELPVRKAAADYPDLPWNSAALGRVGLEVDGHLLTLHPEGALWMGSHTTPGVVIDGSSVVIGEHRVPMDLVVALHEVHGQEMIAVTPTTFDFEKFEAWCAATGVAVERRKGRIAVVGLSEDNPPAVDALGGVFDGEHKLPEHVVRALSQCGARIEAPSIVSRFATWCVAHHIPVKDVEDDRVTVDIDTRPVISDAIADCAGALPTSALRWLQFQGFVLSQTERLRESTKDELRHLCRVLKLDMFEQDKHIIVANGIVDLATMQVIDGAVPPAVEVWLKENGDLFRQELAAERWIAQLDGVELGVVVLSATEARIRGTCYSVDRHIWLSPEQRDSLVSQLGRTPHWMLRPYGAEIPGERIDRYCVHRDGMRIDLCVGERYVLDDGHKWHRYDKALPEALHAKGGTIRKLFARAGMSLPEAWAGLPVEDKEAQLVLPSPSPATIDTPMTTPEVPSVTTALARVGQRSLDVGVSLAMVGAERWALRALRTHRYGRRVRALLSRAARAQYTAEVVAIRVLVRGVVPALAYGYGRWRGDAAVAKAAIELFAAGASQTLVDVVQALSQLPEARELGMTPMQRGEAESLVQEILQKAQETVSVPVMSEGTRS